jgi:hypothetical protein
VTERTKTSSPVTSTRGSGWSRGCPKPPTGKAVADPIGHKATSLGRRTRARRPPASTSSPCQLPVSPSIRLGRERSEVVSAVRRKGMQILAALLLSIGAVATVTCAYGDGGQQQDGGGGEGGGEGGY